MSIDHLHRISDDIVKAGYFAIECDEVTDSSNIEQVIVCFRWVDSTFEPHKEFIGLCSVDNITAELINEVVKDAVLRMKLGVAMCRAQCYDVAANMKKVAEIIKSIEHRSLYLHCYGHSLNLAVADTIKNISTMSNALDHTQEICKLISFLLAGMQFFISSKMRLHQVSQVYGIYVRMSNSLDRACNIP